MGAYTRGVVSLPLLLVAAGGLPLLIFSVLAVFLLRRAAPARRARLQAIAAMCSQRGLTPGVVPIAGPVQLDRLVNPFSSRDGKVVAADAVRSEGKQVEMFSLLSFTVDGLNVPRVAVLRQHRPSLVDLWGPVLELESADFDRRFAVMAKDRRSAVMLLDQGMIQWMLDCDNVSFELIGDRVVAFIDRAAEPAHPPAQPVEYVALFKFWDGFVPRIPPLLRSEYAAAAP
jgi:hypothetical protein